MLDERIEAVRKKYGLSHEDFWQIPQNKQWVCKHAALEVVAVKAGIIFDMPQVIETDSAGLKTSMIVRGTMGDRTEWATGETNPTNYSVKGKQPAYPWAMSEKRAKDRVVLKLVGIHGLVYSEDEADFTQPKAKSRDVFESLQDDIRNASSLKELASWWGSTEIQGLIKSLPVDWQAQIRQQKDEMKAALANKPPVIDPNDSLDEQFPGDMETA